MKLKTFLMHRIKQQPLEAPVIYFSGNQYPAFFCSRFLDQFKQLDKSVAFYALDQFDWQQFESTVSTTFLGSVKTFWLGDLSVLNAQTRKKIIDFLTTYKGPHKILCFVTVKDAPAKSTAIVSLDDPVTKVDLEALFTFLWGTSADAFTKMVKQNYKTLSLDTILLLGYYSVLLGGKTDYFMRTWYEKIVLPEESLFTLSQCFFARKRDLFFRTWLSLKDDYAGPFWTTFWSEQLWRAHHVINLRKANKLSEAKQMSYRLPFSFLQREWKTTSPKELQAAHQFLYEVDCRVKGGGSMLALELFYTKFMSKQF